MKKYNNLGGGCSISNSLWRWSRSRSRVFILALLVVLLKPNIEVVGFVKQQLHHDYSSCYYQKHNPLQLIGRLRVRVPNTTTKRRRSSTIPTGASTTTTTTTTRLYDTTTFAFIHIEPTKQIVLDNINNQLVSTNNNVVIDYVPGATTLFVNMLTPASILAAGMISIGLKSPFQLPPELFISKKTSHRRQEEEEEEPSDTTTNNKVLRHIQSLRRAYVVVALISFCSELLAVMWATVAVNQLTERTNVQPASSVWELVQRDFDLEWAAVNSHFVLGLVGFMYMVGIRGYIMLLTTEASDVLIVSALSGVGSALLLMGSIVNRGVESGSGLEGGMMRYGDTVLDLFGHYVSLLYERSIGHDNDYSSVGPLGLGAIVLEVVSIAFAAYAILFPAGIGRLIPSDFGVEKNTTTITPTAAEARNNDEEEESSPPLIATTTNQPILPPPILPPPDQHNMSHSAVSNGETTTTTGEEQQQEQEGDSLFVDGDVNDPYGVFYRIHRRLSP